MTRYPNPLHRSANPAAYLHPNELILVAHRKRKRQALLFGFGLGLLVGSAVVLWLARG